MLYEYLILIGLAIAPISEARGAILYGIGMGLNPVLTFVISTIANILIIPVVFFVLRQANLREFIFKLFRKTAENHMHKNKMIYLYEELALFAFVAVPLPVTGGYTAVLISELLGWDWRKSFLAISAGITVSAIIVLLAAEGVIHLVGLM
jgi:uncharacterized membrane protein